MLTLNNIRKNAVLVDVSTPMHEGKPTECKLFHSTGTVTTKNRASLLEEKDKLSRETMKQEFLIFKRNRYVYHRFEYSA